MGDKVVLNIVFVLSSLYLDLQKEEVPIWYNLPENSMEFNNQAFVRPS